MRDRLCEPDDYCVCVNSGPGSERIQVDAAGQGG